VPQTQTALALQPSDDSATSVGSTSRSSSVGLPQAEIQALVARAQTGDQDAYAALYNAYSKKIHSYLRYHLNNRAEVAEDLAADVFLKAMEKINSYQFNGVPFSAWLYRIAHNHLIDYLRAQPKKQGVSLEECLGVDDPSAERSLDHTLTQQQLSGAFDGLTEDQRQVIVYRFLQDRSIADTARLMRKNEDAIKQLQVRALRNMRKVLAA